MKKLWMLPLLITLSACSYSEGKRAGQIVKFSRKGILLKTYEGELATLAKGAAGTMINNTFAFSVKDDRIVEEIQQAMDRGSNVTLTYEQAFFAFPWEGDTTYFIVKVSETK